MHGASMIKFKNLMRVSRFRMISACQTVPTNIDLVDSIVFQACFRSAGEIKYKNLMRVSRFRHTSVRQKTLKTHGLSCVFSTTKLKIIENTVVLMFFLTKR